MTAKKVWKIVSNLITGILFLLLIFMIFVVVSSKASGGEPQFLRLPIENSTFRFDGTNI